MVCGLSNGTTVSDLEYLEGHFPVAGLFTCNPSNILQYFTRFQPTARSRGPSATAGLLVQDGGRPPSWILKSALFKAG